MNAPEGNAHNRELLVRRELGNLACQTSELEECIAELIKRTDCACSGSDPQEKGKEACTPMDCELAQEIRAITNRIAIMLRHVRDQLNHLEI